MEVPKDPFDAFYRNDKFGLCGKAKKPLSIKILFILSILWIPIKLLIAMYCLLSATLLCKVLAYIPSKIGRPISIFFIRMNAILMLFGLGFIVSWEKLPRDNLSFQDRFQKEEDGSSFGAYVCNHSSWSDIIIFMANYPVGFVARSGTDRLPMVGTISKTIESIFVDREASGTTNSSGGGTPSRSNSLSFTPSSSKEASVPSSPSAAAAAAAIDAFASATTAATTTPTLRGGNVTALRQRLLRRFLLDDHARHERRQRRLKSDANANGGSSTLPSSPSSSLSSPPSSLVPTALKDTPFGGDGGAAEGALPHLVVFPEATTTNNRYILPFKRGVFVAGVPVRILIFKYSYSLCGMFHPSWEAIDIVWHLFYVLAIPFHRVTCYEGPVYCPNEEEIRDPELFSKNVRQVMMEAGQFQSSSATFESKKVYHMMLGLTKPPKSDKAAEDGAGGNREGKKGILNSATVVPEPGKKNSGQGEMREDRVRKDGKEEGAVSS